MNSYNMSLSVRFINFLKKKKDWEFILYPSLSISLHFQLQSQHNSLLHLLYFLFLHCIDYSEFQHQPFRFLEHLHPLISEDAVIDWPDWTETLHLICTHILGFHKEILLSYTLQDVLVLLLYLLLNHQNSKVIPPNLTSIYNGYTLLYFQYRPIILLNQSTYKKTYIHSRLTTMHISLFPILIIFQDVYDFINN